jgi:uncharacterized protein YjbJ (UPF0337 family)
MIDTPLQHNWTALKGKLKQKYGQLTDDDLIFAEGKGEELMSRLREKLGMSNEELTSTLEELKATTEDKVERMKTTAEESFEQAGSMVDDFKQKAAALGEEVKAQGVVAYDEARARTRGLWEDGEEYVRANPRQTMLTSVAIGFVAAMILLRR